MSKKLHPLILKTKKELEKLDSTGFKTWGERHSYRGSNLPISVEPKLRSRAFNFMNELLNLLEKNNHSVKINCNRSQIEMYGQLTEFNLRQKFYRKREKVDPDYYRNVFVKSEDLEFQVGYSYRKGWIDKKTKKIEDDLQSIFQHIEKKSKYFYELRKSQKIEEEKIEQERILEQEKQRLIAIEESKLEALIKSSQDYKIAKDIRNYLKVFELKKQKEGKVGKKIKEYIKWGNKKADEIDPLKNFLDN